MDLSIQLRGLLRPPAGNLKEVDLSLQSDT